GSDGARETTANMMGPFWRAGSPWEEDGASIVRSPTPGDPIFVTGTVVDRAERAVAGALVEVWNTSGEGIYENQDPGQADMNLRGTFTTDATTCGPRTSTLTAALIGHYVKHDTVTEPAPDPDVTGPWYSLEHRFVVEPGDNSLPRPPITGKATDGAPVTEILERTP
ncbi:MAG TPA: hypothetical protein VGI96_00330, partial [Streptosporangiaceae bacterium]